MTNSPDDPGTAVASVRPRLSVLQQVSLSLYWFASSAHWTAILVTLLPLQAERIGGPDFKGHTLGYIMLFGALVSTVAAPVFGAYSDHVRTRWGRRKPFLVVGTLGNVIGLLALAFIPSVPKALLPFIAAFAWVELFNNLATAPYSAFIPDVVPRGQRGSASGYMGLMMMLGNFLGGITGLALPLIGGIAGAYVIISAIMVAGMLGTVLTVKEPEPEPVPPFRWSAFVRGLAEPFRSADFTWVFLTRFLVVLGTFTVQEFLQYYMKDVVGGGSETHAYIFRGVELADTAQAATSFFILALLVGAIVSAPVGGLLSDRYGRKPMVYVSGAFQGFVGIVFIFGCSFELVVILGVVFGLGYGAYQSVDWALASDVLPSEQDYAKDMGVWHVSLTLPQVMATPVAGLLLDEFQRIGRARGNANLGYQVIFSLAFVYFFLGTVLIRQVKKAR